MGDRITKPLARVVPYVHGFQKPIHMKIVIVFAPPATCRLFSGSALGRGRGTIRRQGGDIGARDGNVEQLVLGVVATRFGNGATAARTGIVEEIGHCATICAGERGGGWQRRCG